jgi:hypothetical protein
LCNSTVARAPVPIRAGNAPVPYARTWIGFCGEPDPRGCSVPWQVVPRRRSSRSPGLKLILLTRARERNAVVVPKPVEASLPAPQSR